MTNSSVNYLLSAIEGTGVYIDICIAFQAGSGSDSYFQAMYAELCKFRDTYGTTIVPRQASMSCELKLAYSKVLWLHVRFLASQRREHCIQSIFTQCTGICLRKNGSSVTIQD